MLRYHLHFLSAVFLLGAALPALAETSRLRLPDTLTEPMRLTAMPPLDQSKVGKLLSRHYQTGLGGPEVFGALESFKFTGTLSAGGADFELSALQKKPGYLKLSIRDPKNQSTMELGFDGQVAWRQANRNEAQPMAPEEARRFAHSASFGSHLLYPYAEGKTIEYIDTVPIEGAICHLLRVTLGSGYQVDYYLDIRSLLETKAVSTDLRSGFVNTVVYRDYVREKGWPIAQVADNFENGKKVSSLKIEEVQINTGVMPWMFRMP